MKISDLIGSEQLIKLLKQKNNEGYTPLEWCLCYNTYGLFRKILETPGLYVLKEEQGCGVVSRWYDVTDYESNPHQNYISHLLYGICFVKGKNLENEKVKSLFYLEFHAIIYREKNESQSICFTMLVSDNSCVGVI